MRAYSVANVQWINSLSLSSLKEITLYTKSVLKIYWNLGETQITISPWHGGQTWTKVFGSYVHQPQVQKIPTWWRKWKGFKFHYSIPKSKNISFFQGSNFNEAAGGVHLVWLYCAQPLTAGVALFFLSWYGAFSTPFLWWNHNKNCEWNECTSSVS